MNKDDISKLVSIVGRSGAIHALIHSDIVKIEELRELARNLNLEMIAKTSKKDLAGKIVRRIDRRITKSVEELEMMNRDEILAYLNKTDCDVGDLKDLLEWANIPIQSKMSRNDLLMLAAIQISSLGVFGRLSNPRCASDLHVK